MKRSLIIVVFVLLTSLVFSQSVYWEETFTPSPTGWSLDDNWSFSGGTLQLSWSPTITNYDLSAVSPVISLPDNVGDLVVTQFIDAYSPVNEIMEIGVIVNGTPQELWQYELIGGNWGIPGGQDITLSLSDFAGEDVQLQFRSYGSSISNFNSWTIYNILVADSLDNDLAVTEVAGPTYLEQNQQGTWTVTVKNPGLLTQDDYTVRFFKHDGFEIGSIQSTISLENNDTADFDFSWTPSEIESTALYGQVILGGDEFPDNDTKNHYLRVNSETQLNVLILDNDNDSYYFPPETGNYIGCEGGIVETLELNGIGSTVVTSLPANLSAYDIVFVELGLWCLG
ncbi:MAG: hypothetical protein KAR20_07650 [Candidatus Heimdallarchaeota archaeon]|nr:hypothetical protein [Candidatus Heimdallarchaeota archaeon]